MYKLLIVDDEKSIRSGIANGIPWEDWGFTVTATASDGLEALELIAADKPDVVLSDIRMPNMDGVELMQYLNKNYPEIKIIILSGYSDFDYLNYSIKNNVTEYLLKPTDLDEFETLFKKMKNTLDAERQKESVYKSSRRYYLDSVLTNMMLGYVPDISQKIDETVFTETGINPDLCRVVLISMEWDPKYRDDMERNKTKQTIIDIINNIRSECISHFFLGYQEKIMGIVCQSDASDLSDSKIHEYLCHVVDAVRSQVGIDTYACVSNLCTDRRMLPQCLQQTIAASHQFLFKISDHVVFYRPANSGDTNIKTVNFKYDLLTNYIISGKKEQADAEINRAFDEFEKLPESSYNYIENTCLELLFYLSRKSMAYNINFEQIMEDSGFGYDDLRRFVNLQIRRKLILEAVDALTDCFSLLAQSDDKNTNLAKKIKDLVDNEYLCNHISLEYVSGKVKKSSAYVSRLFKDEYGCNFSEYITNKRLEKSKELLADKSLKIYEIANKTGYADTSNFIKVFKKKYGISPGDYRSYIK